jgi:RNA polymerase-binding transcription factor DksA
MTLDTNRYKTVLTEQLGELTEELKTVGIHNPENPKDWIAVPEGVDPDEPDTDMVADVAEDWGERAALVATLETRYNNLTRALKKLEEGTFGTCEVCGGAVEVDRLDANPAARTDKAHMDEESSLAM